MNYLKIAAARQAALLAATNISRRALHLTAPVASGHEYEMQNSAPEMAGDRDYVGYFLSGDPAYSDRLDMPYPSIRFRRPTADVLALREKEKGDWKNLSMEEKKQLYRNTFRATFCEMEAPTGHWKVITAGILGAFTMTMIITIFMRRWIHTVPAVHNSNESKEIQLKYMIETYMDPLRGPAAKWDYDNNRWKA